MANKEFTTAVSEATEKTTLISSDKFNIINSADSNRFNSISWETLRDNIPSGIADISATEPTTTFAGQLWVEI